MKKLFCLLALIFSGQAHAYDGMSSQIPHAVGGALLAGAIAKSFEENQHRALIGASISTTLFAAVEAHQLGTGSRRHGQMLDIYYHTLGSVIGAWATDKFILLPLMSPDSIGVAYTQNF